MIRSDIKDNLLPHVALVRAWQIVPYTTIYTVNAKTLVNNYRTLKRRVAIMWGPPILLPYIWKL